MKTIDTITVVHQNVLLSETLSLLLSNSQYPDCKVNCAQGLENIQRDAHKTLFIIDADLITDPANGAIIESIRRTGTSKIINLSSSQRSISACQLTQGAFCWVAAEDGLEAIVEAITKADNHDSFVSPTRIKQSTVSSISGLTKREIQCCTYCLYDINDISLRLGLSKNSVRTYFERARYKLGLDNQQQLIAWSVLNGITHVPMGAEDVITGRRNL